MKKIERIKKGLILPKEIVEDKLDEIIDTINKMNGHIEEERQMITTLYGFEVDVLANGAVVIPKELVDRHFSKLYSPKQYFEKPMKGLRPKKVATEARITEINKAMNRYRKAGKDIPQAWFDEKIELTARLERNN